MATPEQTLPPYDYGNLTAVVTGGASGIGRALCLALAGRGARVAVVDVDGDAATAVAADAGRGARGYRCDVADPAAIGAVAAAVADAFGGVNLVFANAGVYRPGGVLETPPADVDWLFDVNVKGMVRTVQAFAPMVLAQARQGRPSRFVLTGSENSLGLPPVGANTVYTATKHAVLGLADGLRRDLHGTGTGVSVLCPGAVNTRLWDSGRARPAAYGGAVQAEPAFAARAQQAFAAVGYDPARIAALCLKGIERGDFLIVTHPEIRGFAMARHREVEAALDRTDALAATMGDAE